ncbi:hypothetical protein OPS25_14030 [Alteromonas ponticola]|uniref:Uncharacterized protein n=1 Tax=Alteromonas aquimaris TaxID=2998417 RepID=A0ABT3PA90_9ALTE|nr:hypothetical protein [Alteromonas aquimaris]MCW8109624.1 hypothetical protein [Alteromonas aquimaris]
MKSFFIAMIIAITLAYCLGDVANSWWGMNIIVGDEIVSPFESVLAVAAMGLVFGIIGFIIAVSVIGAIVIGIGAAAVALFAMGVSAFWPVLLIAAIIYLMRKDTPRHAVS